MDELEREDIGWSTNSVVGGIEIFTKGLGASPSTRELEQLGWRWSNSTQSWYHRDTPENAQFARRFCDELRRTKPR